MNFQTSHNTKFIPALQPPPTYDFSKLSCKQTVFTDTKAPYHFVQAIYLLPSPIFSFITSQTFPFCLPRSNLQALSLICPPPWYGKVTPFIRAHFQLYRSDKIISSGLEQPVPRPFNSFSASFSFTIFIFVLTSRNMEEETIQPDNQIQATGRGMELAVCAYSRQSTSSLQTLYE